MDSGLADEPTSSDAQHFLIAPTNRRYRRVSEGPASGVIAMRPLLRPFLLSLIVVGCAQMATGQELGTASAGFDYASQICSGCHAVQKGGNASPNEKAPPFAAIANARGMTELALRVWFQTPHPTMPNLMMSPRQKDDVIAYILSLKERD